MENSRGEHNVETPWVTAKVKSRIAVATEERKAAEKEVNAVNTEMLLLNTPTQSELLAALRRAFAEAAVFIGLGSAGTFLLSWALMVLVPFWWRWMLAAGFVLGGGYVFELHVDRNSETGLKPYLPSNWVSFASSSFAIGGVLFIIVRGLLAAAAVTVSGLDPRQIFERAAAAEGSTKALGIAAFMFLVAGLDVGSALALGRASFAFIFCQPHLLLHQRKENAQTKINGLRQEIAHLEVVEKEVSVKAVEHVPFEPQLAVSKTTELTVPNGKEK